MISGGLLFYFLQFYLLFLKELYFIVYPGHFPQYLLNFIKVAILLQTKLGWICLEDNQQQDTYVITMWGAFSLDMKTMKIQPSTMISLVWISRKS